ncbi:MAG: N-acetyl-gamma-glutamyl-phosphate reductase [Deltaproteobacteria bacterium]|nr:N-acetyl-gamma-glutamyl-phosphate reductase [Deltaproteobacteria bacterium]
MLRIGIFGASGYTGQELLRLLLRHPEVRVDVVTSRQYKGQPVADVFPLFVGLTDLEFSDATPEIIAESADLVFLALPHGTSMQFAPAFFRTGKKIIDLSADFRLRSVDAYEQWYGKHGAADLIREAVYGMPELYREAIGRTRFVAVPGCYPTGAILGLAPVLREHWIDTKTIIVDAKSGASGAGREPQTASLFCEVNGGFKAYKIGQHRHTPEMEQELGLLAGVDVTVLFTPHLAPMNRGILSTIYATLEREVTASDLVDLYREHYERDKFVRVYKPGLFPNVSAIRGSNYCDIGLAVDKRTKRVVIVSAVDNLIKGASGAAVQCMNVMCGFPEAAGLDMVGLAP